MICFLNFPAVRLAVMAMLCSNLMACATRLPEKSVANMTDTELLIAFGQAARGKITDASKTGEFDGEIQKRQLLTAAETIKVQDAHIYEGISSAAALASFGAPEGLGTSPNFPGVQAWTYPYDPHNSGTLYVYGGKVIGYRIAPERDQNSRLKWAQGGRTFPQRFEIRQCRAHMDSNAIVTNCRDLDVGSRRSS